MTIFYAINGELNWIENRLELWNTIKYVFFDFERKSTFNIFSNHYFKYVFCFAIWVSM